VALEKENKQLKKQMKEMEGLEKQKSEYEGKYLKYKKWMKDNFQTILKIKG